MTEQYIIAQIWEAKKKKQKFVTIPKDSDLKAGEYVEIRRLKNG